MYHKPAYTNYPVRLTGEIFSRCLEYSKKKQDICIYDPCCGSAYMITVLGYLFNETINTIYASDVSGEALELSLKNLSLLSYKGIIKRKEELTDLVGKYGKKSHNNALNSLETLLHLIKHEIKCNAFNANILNAKELINKKFTADIVITDVPYENLTAWSDNSDNPIDDLLNTINPVINSETIIAVSHTKMQKINSPTYEKLEKLRAGHRKIEILKLR
jgi:hypothetical protein